MVVPSLDFIEGSIIIMIVGYIIALIFQLYMLFLNYKQSRVNNQMKDLVDEVVKIRKELQKMQTRTTKKIIPKKTQVPKKTQTKKRKK